ncbi:MAG: nicotinamide riboside transporter PnuC [Leadbetterella sp.]|nr:nicotinamide riboside transporter PnuC [Leadbetterella sp.]
MPDFFSLKNIFFTVFGYEMSHLEFWATLTGGLAVWLSARENVWSWVIGLFNVSLAFIMFHQSQLYPDMFLQVFFFATNIIGFWLWKFPKAGKANQKMELRITRLSTGNYLLFIVGVAVATLAFGFFAKNLHEILPDLFHLPSAFPYIDSFILVASVATTFLMMNKKVETWWMWLLIDIISCVLYYTKEIRLYSLLYLVFCFIATYGALDWTRKYKSYEVPK